MRCNPKNCFQYCQFIRYFILKLPWFIILHFYSHQKDKVDSSVPTTNQGNGSFQPTSGGCSTVAEAVGSNLWAFLLFPFSLFFPSNSSSGVIILMSRRRPKLVFNLLRVCDRRLVYSAHGLSLDLIFLRVVISVHLFCALWLSEKL